MNAQLTNALRELKEAGAQGVPAAELIMSAADGSRWSGSSLPSGSWELEKHKSDSYTTHTGNQ